MQAVKAQRVRSAFTIPRLAEMVELPPDIAARDHTIRRQTCRKRGLCFPLGLTDAEAHLLDPLIAHRTKLRRNEPLYRAGGRSRALFTIRLGSLKTSVLADDGREQVTGYHIAGDMIGFDGIGTECHGATAVALEDTEVCALAILDIEDLARRVPTLQHCLHQLLSHEVMNAQRAMLGLGSMRAEERLVMFLLNLAERYRERGYSSSEFVLRMTREEIGSYLGLKLETVSRLFSRLQGEGLLQVQGRGVKLLDPVRLKAIVGQCG